MKIACISWIFCCCACKKAAETCFLDIVFVPYNLVWSSTVSVLYNTCHLQQGKNTFIFCKENPIILCVFKGAYLNSAHEFDLVEHLGSYHNFPYVWTSKACGNACKTRHFHLSRENNKFTKFKQFSLSQ